VVWEAGGRSVQGEPESAVQDGLPVGQQIVGFSMMNHGGGHQAQT
jgi:hypothetical protein